jgi:bifunctional UDP-N-acetylglucosamine pyrophosphorylase/glucosamine-1-phosphate N-acetyltransferase
MIEMMISSPPPHRFSRSCLAVVLAAGEGTRMKSALPKVLHPIAGRSMLGHVLETMGRAGATRIAVVVGPNRADVEREAGTILPDVEIFAQRERLGTAHAVLSARSALENPADDVVIAFADTPLVGPETFGRLRAPLADGAAVVVLGFEAKDPTGYGRLILADRQLTAIREHRDASAEEKGVTLCNAGLMAIRGDLALDILSRIGNDNAKGEFYLTDAVEVAHRLGHRVVTVMAPEDEVQGINDRAQLAAAERTIQDRLRQAAMADGVTLIAPQTVFFSHDTAIGRDTVIEPHVVFGPGVTVGEGVLIHAFSHLEGANVAAGAQVGPYARLRPGASLGPGSKVGNFVEIKNSELGAGAKAGHLTYLGDATIGADVNIGAGTITCNYDGFGKYRTVIKDGAFIGSNSSLVAPVTIGSGAYTASGSVITEDVPDDALGLGRSRQVSKNGWARQFRERFQTMKRK